LCGQTISDVVTAAFAAVALGLARHPHLRLMSYSVSQRTHEIGIRMVLGGIAHGDLRLVVGRGMVLGDGWRGRRIGGALLVDRFLSSLLYGVGAEMTPVTFSARVAVLLSAVAALASLIPSWRAARIDPMEALRYE